MYTASPISSRRRAQCLLLRLGQSRSINLSTTKTPTQIAPRKRKTFILLNSMPLIYYYLYPCIRLLYYIHTCAQVRISLESHATVAINMPTLEVKNLFTRHDFFLFFRRSVGRRSGNKPSFFFFNWSVYRVH